MRFGDAFRKKIIGNTFDDTDPEQDLISPDEENEVDDEPEQETPLTKAEQYKKYGIEIIDLNDYPVDEKAVNLITGDVAKRFNAIPVAFDKTNIRNLLVAMADPMDIIAIDDISIITNMQVVPLAAESGQIAILIDKFFGAENAKAVAEEYRNEFNIGVKTEQEQAAIEAVADAPIVQLVKGMIEQAIHRRASDIHIEPLETHVRLRYRIDGALIGIMKYDLSLLPVIVSRVKIISGMDISEKRIPQDGRSSATVNGETFDIRVSTLPTVYGEKVVMRLNAQSTMRLNKARLGIRGKELDDLNEMMKYPHGILLVTGPTGSGKSTTLYTALNELNTEEVNIITVEDPVEVNIPGINQVQVNDKANLTFANALRSILRQDPDIIMIGEMRDNETAAIAVQAAITGHLVVSTIHTNSTYATIARLIDMGIEPFLAADALIGLIAQRLARKLCDCKQPYEANEDEKRLLGMPLDEPLTLYKPVGCPKCAKIGYFGRVAFFETMRMTPEIRMLIARKATSEEIKAKALEQGMHTLHEGIKTLILEGTTSIGEIRKAEA